jgi:hypothetical protein
MKRFLANFLTISGVALLMLTSCKKSDQMITTNGGTPGALTASSTTLPLDKSKVSDPSTAVTFNFTAPKYSYKAAVTNTIQFDSVGDNWKNPQSATLAVNVLTQAYNTADFNAIMLKLIPAGVASKINVRVQHALSSSVATYSNVVEMTVTPFNLTSWLYAVGSFQGWNLNALDSLESKTGNGVYTGIINFPANARDFLILPQKTNYDNKYATTDPVNATSSTVTVGAANNFYSPAAAGQYIVTLNLNSNTISFAAADYYSLIGNDFTGQNWDTDNFMKYINDGTNTWKLTLPMVATVNGGFKIRQDAAWSKSWGFLHTPDGLHLTYQTDPNTGAINMSISSAGTYTVSFIQPATAFGTTPIDIVPYTITKQ